MRADYRARSRSETVTAKQLPKGSLPILLRFSVILVFVKTVPYLLLPYKTTVQEKLLPAETDCMIILPAVSTGILLSQQDSESHKQTQQEAIYHVQHLWQDAKCLGRNMADSTGSKKWWTSLFPADIMRGQKGILPFYEIILKPFLLPYLSGYKTGVLSL